MRKSGKAPDFLLKGKIVLIQKEGKDPTNPNSYRQITLQEIARKVISRELCSRIIECMLIDNPILENQFCHPGRDIRDIMLTIQMMISANQKTSHLAAVDFKKVFDSVDHEFLLEVLKRGTLTKAPLI